MTLVLAIAVALLVTVGVELLLARSLFRAILGFSLLAHAANLVVLASGEGGSAPVLGAASDAPIADPLPQALVLTAIVISMAITLYLVGLLWATARETGQATQETPPSSDDGRDPVQIAAELRGKAAGE